jgi:hypothetical protein
MQPWLPRGYKYVGVMEPIFEDPRPVGLHLQRPVAPIQRVRGSRICAPAIGVLAVEKQNREASGVYNLIASLADPWWSARRS